MRRYNDDDSRHVEDERNDGANDDERVHHVPNVSQIGARMSNHAKINHLFTSEVKDASLHQSQCDQLRE